MKACPRCGGALPNDAWECRFCGSDISELSAKRIARPSKPKVTTRKYNGDDAYSWAVFVGGRVRTELTGLNRSQATYYANRIRSEK